MGSEQFQRHAGLKRASEGGQGDPAIFTVIGVDTTAEQLTRRYVGTRNADYAAEVIAAVVQLQRTKGPPPAGFIATLRGGVRAPIIVCDLGPDAKGKSWMVVVDGRHRTLGLRLLNDEAHAKGHPPKMLQVVFQPFARKTAGLDALMCKVVANARVPRSVSARAEDAMGLALQHIAHEDIAPLVEAQDATEVAQLIALATCVDEVQLAVNAGKLALAACVALSRMSAEEQARIVARKLAPNRKAANEAAAARPRARSAKLGLGFIQEIDRANVAMNADARAILQWFGGKDDALDGFPSLLGALTRARGAPGKASPGE